MLYYTDVEDTLIKLELNYRSLDQALEAMWRDTGEVKLDTDTKGIINRIDGYNNTFELLRTRINDLFEELHAIVESDGEIEEEIEKELEGKTEGEQGTSD